MRAFAYFAALCGLFVCASALRSAEVHPSQSARNQFVELLGKTDAEVTAKTEKAWKQLFYGSDASERLYYPVEPDLAYIADVNNRDVRTEGMSYGMMIAVQLDHQAEFNRLWKWAKVHMYHAEGERRGYFSWQCEYSGRQIDPGSASDGEEWFTMALLFASHRWGDGVGIFNYQAEAQALLHAMRTKHEAHISSLFDRDHHQVVFAPTADARDFTDASYHLPAFYELWARWDLDPAGRDFWREAALASRVFFKKAAHPKTGLMPERSNFDGSPHTERNGGIFAYDAWRTFSNVALDYFWFKADPWAIEQSNRVLRFFQSQGPHLVQQYTLDGKPLSTDHSTGLVAMAAVASLAADPSLSKPFVQKLWDAQIPSGRYRYYDGMLYLLGLLEISGQFQIYAPAK